MRVAFLATILLAPVPAIADDITDALQAAIGSYEAGDVGEALEEITYATQLLNALQAQGFSAYLPEPLDGWTREVEENAGASLGFIGGGTAASANYSGPSGQFSITMMADNPMVMSMAGILGNSGLMATMGTIERINRENFLNDNGDLSGLIGNRILIQAEGGSNLEDVIAHLETIDFDELARFGN